MDYAGIAQKEKLTELQLRVRQLLAQVDQINKEQNYQRVSTEDPQCAVWSFYNIHTCHPLSQSEYNMHFI